MSVAAVAEKPSLAAELADEIMEPWLQWLRKVGCEPKKFSEAMKCGQTLEGRARLLDISTDELLQGVESIKSLHLYGEIVGMSPERLWEAFEHHQHLAPRWLIRDVEEGVRTHFALQCQTS